MSLLLKAFISNYLRDAMGFLLVYDITNESSFHHINDWLVQLHSHCYDEHPPVVLVGNKLDQSALRTVSNDAAQSLSSELGYNYIETSALESVNVSEAVDMLLQQVLTKISDGSLLDENRNYLTIAPNQVQGSNEKQGSSCSC